MDGQHPKTSNQHVLDDARGDFISRFPAFGRQLIEFLERDESTIVYVKTWGRGQAALRVFPASAITKQFDISLEVPTLVADFPTLQPRVLRQLDTSVELRRSASADKDVGILVASDRRANDYVRDRKRFAFPVLVLDIERLQDGGYARSDLRTELGRLLRSVDHFDFSNEITTGADFFGRIGETEDLTRLALAGQSAGVFGLRRSGKTSLLHRVRDELGNRGVSSIYIQLNAFIDADSLRGEIVDELDRLASELGRSKQNRSSNGQMTIREWVYAVNELLELIDRQVVIVIDEIDLANEDAAEFDDSEAEARKELNRVLQQLRGIIQIRNDRSENRLSFLVAGVAMSVFTQAIRFGRENQLFGFASARPLAPMDRDEMREMVRTLGKRSGLKFDGFELFDQLLAEYGGQPHLTRRACSAIASEIRDDNDARVPYPVTASDLQRAFTLVGENSPSSAAIQTLRAFARWYPDEGDRVAAVVAGDGPADPATITHAVQFGICHEDGSLRIGALSRSGS